MNRSYWEKIAPDYNDEIFDVLKNDNKGLIVSAIKDVASQRKTVIDVGCAVGKWLPILSASFRKVFAVDISSKNLMIAKKTYPHLANVNYLQIDMSVRRREIPKCNVAVCINAILTGSLKKRMIFFNSLASCVTRNGHLVLVVPSLESYLFSSIVANQWKIDRNILNKGISASEAQQKLRHIKEGNADIDNVPTKHYLKEELALLLDREGFAISDFQKVEYDWRTEFIKPPKWLKEPKPWDWLVLARKK